MNTRTPSVIVQTSELVKIATCFEFTFWVEILAITEYSQGMKVELGFTGGITGQRANMTE